MPSIPSMHRLDFAVFCHGKREPRIKKHSIFDPGQQFILRQIFFIWWYDMIWYDMMIYIYIHMLLRQNNTFLMFKSLIYGFAEQKCTCYCYHILESRLVVVLIRDGCAACCLSGNIYICVYIYILCCTFKPIGTKWRWHSEKSIKIHSNVLKNCVPCGFHPIVNPSLRGLSTAKTPLWDDGMVDPIGLSQVWQGLHRQKWHEHHEHDTPTAAAPTFQGIVCLFFCWTVPSGRLSRDHRGIKRVSFYFKAREGAPRRENCIEILKVS